MLKLWESICEQVAIAIWRASQMNVFILSATTEEILRRDRQWRHRRPRKYRHDKR